MLPICALCWFPRVSKGLKGQTCLAAHCFSSLPVCIMHSLASIPLLLILEDKGGPTHGH